jgi:hypothetical protein
VSIFEYAPSNSTWYDDDVPKELSRFMMTMPLRPRGLVLCLLSVLTFGGVHARAGLIAHWRFDENGGATAQDSAGTFHGTLGGGAMFVGGGISGNALSLDQASASLVNIGTSFPGFTEGDFSIALWIKTTTTALDSIYFGRHEAFTPNGYFLALNTSSIYGRPDKAWFSASSAPGHEAISTTTVNDGNWHHIVGVYKAGGTLAIYVDGAPFEEVKTADPVGASPAPVLFGGINMNGTPKALFTGLIDDAQVYDRALSSSEVQFLFTHPGGLLPLPLTTIVNPSFEVDPVPPFPGYGPITGWTPDGEIGTSYGINEFGMPFAGNGAVPDGTKVAFIQHNGTLSQDVPGFRIGAQYWLTYRENARQGCCGGTGSLAVTVDDETIVRPHPVTPVGGTNPYRDVGSEVFTARDETLTIGFVKDGEGDITALIDLVQIMEIPPGTTPGVTEHPTSQRADPGESVTFAGAAVGSAPMFFEWWFNGVQVVGETNKTLTLAEVTPAHAGTYWFVVMNAAGSTISSGASLAVRSGIPVIINPSFERDPVPPSPGYGPINGWTPDEEIGISYGINPMNGAFCDNGAVPHGAKVGFLQHNGTLSQTVSGFRPGAQYWLSYRENARQNCCGDRVATLSVTVGGMRVVPEHPVPIVGGIEPFRLVTSQLFTAKEADLTIAFEKGGTGDATALIDDVRIFPLDNFKLGIMLRNGTTPVIRIDGAPGASAILEFKDSLLPIVPWQPFMTVPVIDGSAIAVDIDPPGSNRYYRAQHAP